MSLSVIAFHLVAKKRSPWEEREGAYANGKSQTLDKEIASGVVSLTAVSRFLIRDKGQHRCVHRSPLHM